MQASMTSEPKTRSLATIMIIYQSNRLENLLRTFCAIISENPLADPMAAEVVVAQNQGAGRWLCQQVADRLTVCANIEVPLPASFFARVFADTMGEMPDISLFGKETLIWRVMAALDALVEEPFMAEISAYLKDDQDGRNLFQLSSQIADLFDQYQVYRIDLLLAWEQGQDDHWQARIWRWLTGNQAESTHRASLITKFSDAIESGKITGDSLPERVFFFAINMLAPVYLDIIDKISRLTAVHIFHLSPCCEYWQDVTPERLLAIKRKTWREDGIADLSSYFSSGNPLLASLGMVAQEFSSLLMGYEPLTVDLYSQPGEEQLLAMIQGDILNIENRNEQNCNEKKQFCLSDDKSIRFHCCHSPLREIQVLHDRLLDLFNEDADLNPSDILVMAPDIQEYLPLINGVFTSVSGNMRIPWSVSDLPRTGTVIDGFLAILTLASSRFTAGEVLTLLANPAIMRSLNIDDDDIVSIRAAALRAGVRWGLNRKQKRKFVEDNSELNSWEAGLDRLLLGFMTGSLENPFLDILPVDFIPPEAAHQSGVLADFFTDLKWLYNSLSSSHSLQVWVDIFEEIISRFFAGADEPFDTDELLVLRQLFVELSENCKKSGFGSQLKLVVVRQYCEDRLGEPSSRQRSFDGRVAFSNMVPMRSLPFKVIYLLGMNDGSFPRNCRFPEFDLIAANPRLGDRSRRDDDRYLFLEALLSARSHFLISWVGRSQADNNKLPVSVVVAELMDYIDGGWRGVDGQDASRQLITEYPLQPFATNCFDGSQEFTSYAGIWLPPEKKQKPVKFIKEPLPLPMFTEIDMAGLVRFWNHPVRFFLEHRLGMRLYKDAHLVPESEPFNQDNLQKYHLTNDIIRQMQSSNDLDVLHIHNRYLHDGLLPREPFASLLYDEVYDEATELIKDLAGFLKNPVDPEIINIDIGGINLRGELGSLYERGRICFRPSKLKGSDTLALWIHHLALLLAKPAGVQPVSIHRASDRVICFYEVDNPRDELKKLIDLFKQGHSEPLHFYPRTSLAWAEAKPESRMNKARKTWYSGYKYRGEEEDVGYALITGGDDPLDSQFEELGQVFFPILRQMHQRERGQATFLAVCTPEKK
jgi:exodeoxyribonuclease V gamma subunit